MPPRRFRARSATTASAIFVIPVPGTKVTVASTSSFSGGRARLREAVRERHREARSVRRRDELLRARAPVRLLGARRPRHVEWPEGAAPDARDRPGAFHERARPGDVCGAIGHQLPSSSVAFDGDGRAGPDQRRERAALVRGFGGLGERLGIGTGCDGAAEISEATIRCPAPSTSSIVIVQCTSMRSAGVPAR